MHLLELCWTGLEVARVETQQAIVTSKTDPCKVGPRDNPEGTKIIEKLDGAPISIDEYVWGSMDMSKLYESSCEAG